MFCCGVVEAILFFGAIFVALYWYLTSNFDYWKKRNVVYDKPYPIVGTFYKQILTKEHLSVTLQKIYNKYPTENAIGGFMAKKPVLILRDPELIKLALLKDFQHFQDRGIINRSKLHREPLLQHLALAVGDTWKVLRKKLSPTFTSGKMKNAFPLLIECGKEFQIFLRDIIVEGQEPEMKDLMAKFTTDVIGTYAFGIKMNSMKDESAPFRMMGRNLFIPSRMRMLKLGLNQILPSVYHLLGFRIFPKYVDNFFVDLFKSVVKSRDNKPSSRHDFIDLLIELKTKGYVENDKTLRDESDLDSIVRIDMTDELLTAQAFVFFTAGFETTSTTMSFALYELAKNPLVQQNLLEEIDKILLKQDGKLTYESLNEMHYLKMVINETLRKYPPAGQLNRICTIPYTFPNTTISLDKGVILNVPLYAIHYDPKHYPEPERFIPERFTPEEEAKRHPFAYLPFGDGPRVCIGLRFAKLQTMIGLVAFLEHYSVGVSSKTVDEIKLSNKNVIMSCEDGIYLKITPRK